MKFPSLRERVVGIDTETTGLKWALGDRLFGVSLAMEGWSGYFDVRRNPEVLSWLREELPKANLIIGHHLKFDVHMLANEGINLLYTPWHCTMITETLCYEHHNSYGLDETAKRRLGMTKRGDMIAEWMTIGGHRNKKAAMANLADAPYELVATYAIRDAELLLPIFKEQMLDIQNQELGRVYDLEMQLLPVLFDMERHGVRCDVEAAHKAIPELTKIIEADQAILNQQVGFEMNVNSTPQVRKVFQPEPINKRQFKLIDGTICWATDAGGPRIDQNILKEMVHPAALLIRKIRKITKLRDTFISGHILSNIDNNGFVHTTFNSTRNDADAGTVTGRLSSTDPALQQINGRDADTSKILRSMFLPDEGDEWLGADFSSADFRIAAHYLNDPRMLSAYAENPNTDFHGFVSEMTGIPRSPAYAGGPSSKTLNLCVGGDIEYLTREGWKKISEYGGEDIAQWENGVINFVKPIYHSGWSDDVYQINAKWGTIVATGGHRMPIQDPEKEYALKDVFVNQTFGGNRSYSLFTTWNNHGTGIDWSDAELRMLIAFQADGLTNYNGRSYKGASFIFSRERKISRIKQLLDGVGAQYSESTLSGGNTRIAVLYGKDNVGYHGITATPRWLSKDLWIINPFDLNEHQKKVILDELVQWDGSISKSGNVPTPVYSTSVKRQADFVQILASSMGINTSINTTVFDKETWNDHYRVRYGLQRRRSYLSKNVTRTDPCNVYCFSVPSTYFVARTSEGQIFISGNSMAFGAGAGKIALQMGMPFTIEERNGKMILLAGEEAQRVIDAYHEKFPVFKSFSRSAADVAKNRGYVKSLMGRKLRFVNNDGHKAAGYLFQSGCAEVMKTALVRVWHLLQGTDYKLFLTVHDEVGISAPVDGKLDDEIQRVYTDYQSEEAPFLLRVPMTSTFKRGANWYETK